MAALDRAFLRFYRGRPVRDPVGVRFVEGFFWPHIDGRARRQTRVELSVNRERRRALSDGESSRGSEDVAPEAAPASHVTYC